MRLFLSVLNPQSSAAHYALQSQSTVAVRHQRVRAAETQAGTFFRRIPFVGLNKLHAVQPFPRFSHP